ncbi:hypothetical protein MLD38_019239 [Melastoma candidum]|uniref:Uncharacterized protein n=1 Tax=Melastoma candidum TaxID=119954 RepID=A0ACB9R0E2_9MYRT|nr:hypothetical protein MLD38_019239 [Melastoma candidum]
MMNEETIMGDKVLGNVCLDNKFLDPVEFKRQGYMIIDFLSDYYARVHEYPILSQVEPGYLARHLSSSAPREGEPLENLLEDVTKFIIPGLTHWQSPGFFGYFPSSLSAATVLGESLSAGFSVVSFNWQSAPAATELEHLVMDWLAQAMGLPEHFLFSGSGGGVILGSTCEAIVCTLVAVRDQVLAERGRISLEKLVVYCSDQTHCSLQKAARIVGINPNNVRVLRTTMETAMGLSPTLLRETIEADVDSGHIPLYLCATIGTTSTTAVDPVLPLCKIAKEYGIWVHVDAAYAGATLICPEYRGFSAGIEFANSFSFNAHKWFLCTPAGCCCLWVKDQEALTRSLSMEADYLRNAPSDSKRVIDYKDWQIPLSRRFNSLRVWLVLSSYGIEGLQNHIRNHVRLAKIFEGLVEEDERFKVVCPRYFALVCFRLLHPCLAKRANGHATENGQLVSNIRCAEIGHSFSNGHAGDKGHSVSHSHAGKSCYSTSNGHTAANSHAAADDIMTPYASKGGGGGEEINKLNQKLVQSINESGRVFLTHAMIEGNYILRFAVGTTTTKESDVRMAWEVVQENASRLLLK